MFGRLNKKKRELAIRFLEDRIEKTAEFVVWLAIEEERTPTRPYIDEVYLFSYLFIAHAYLGWRKNRPDAYEDLRFVFDSVFSKTYANQDTPCPKKSKANSEQEYLDEILDLVDGRMEEYLNAMDQELAGIASSKKDLGGSFGAGGGIGRDIMAAVMAGTPFLDLVVQRIFDLDPNDEEIESSYRAVGAQLLLRVSKDTDTVRRGISSL